MYGSPRLRSESGSQIFGAVEYNTDLFERSTIRRMIGHYIRVLESVTEDPDVRISQIAIGKRFADLRRGGVQHGPVRAIDDPADDRALHPGAGERDGGSGCTDLPDRTADSGRAERARELERVGTGVCGRQRGGVAGSASQPECGGGGGGVRGAADELRRTEPASQQPDRKSTRLNSSN